VSDPVLTAGQYSIGRDLPGGDSAALVFGTGTSVLVAVTEVDTGSPAVQDQPVVGHDGMLFGVDTLPGMIVTQTGQAWVPNQGNAAQDAYGALSGKWNDPAVRLANGSMQVLRAFYPGSAVVRRCFGRGRKIVPAMGLVHTGLVPFTAQFQAADNTWYSDTQFSLNLTQVPSFSGGLTPPMTPPYQLAATTNFQANTVLNNGPMPTWPIVSFTGPVSFPGITYVNTPVTIGYNGSLKSSDTLVIDTRPWVRTALLNGKSVAGLLTGDPMIGLQLQPGGTLTHFTGQDFTGTSTCVIRWRNAQLSIGGSTA
jgi:hypothetical protein